jgi:uncharacterized membrane protein YeiB
MAAALTRTLVNVPEALEELLIVVVVTAAVVAVHAFLQRRLRSEVLRRHNDVAGYLFSAVGILYAVLLGFVVVVVWQKYDATVANVQDEVDAAADLYHVVDGFPPVARAAVRRDLAQYAHRMIEREWPAMARGEDIPDAGAGLLDDASYRIDSFSPTSRRGLNAQQAAINDEQRLLDARRQRLIHAAPAVPSILWFALIAGALAMVAFCYVFGVENRPAQLLMTAILVGLIGMLFVVVYEFATPFSGSVTISSDGWTYLAQRLADIR